LNHANYVQSWSNAVGKRSAVAVSHISLDIGLEIAADRVEGKRRKKPPDIFVFVHDLHGLRHLEIQVSHRRGDRTGDVIKNHVLHVGQGSL
jgi:hypothetical protein